MTEQVEYAKKIRDTNIIDIFRIIAAFAIVWYHSGYFAKLSGTQLHVVIFAKLLLISFAMPFFYSIMSEFALISSCKSNFSKTFVRIKKILTVMLFFTLLYELQEFLWHIIVPSYKYSFLNCFDTTNNTFSIVNIFNTFINVNYTPGYFLGQAIFISLVTFFIGKIIKNKVLQNLVTFSLMGLLLYIILFNNESMFKGFYLSKMSIAYCTIGTLYAMLSSKLNFKLFEYKNKIFTGLIIIFSILFFGTFILIDYKYEHAYPFMVAFSILPTFIFPFLGTQNYAVKSTFFDFLSYLGQKYSLGVFMYHQFFLNIYDAIAMFGIKHYNMSPNVLVYIIINLLGFISALVLTKITYKCCPKLVSLN